MATAGCLHVSPLYKNTLVLYICNSLYIWKYDLLDLTGWSMTLHYSVPAYSGNKVFMEPSDYYDALINKVLHFIWSVGLIKG
jgi:hypothetical protein